MFKKTLKSNKSSINRDTLLIIQVFVLILLVFLIVNQVDTFKNNKAKHKEGFVDDQTDTVKLHINGVVDDEIYKDKIILELREKKTKEVEIFLDFLSEVTKGTSADNNIVTEKFKMWREVREETTLALKQFAHKFSFQKSSGIIPRIAIGYRAWSDS